MEKFISFYKNPYEKILDLDKENIKEPGKFIPSFKGSTYDVVSYGRRNITGKKIVFKKTF